MNLGIMQPYFLPYLGYWQLMNAVDKYVVYDDIEFTKNSWIRRNRILSGGTDKLFSLPLKNASDYLDIKERYLSDNFSVEKTKLLRLFEASYKKAPMFDTVFPIIKNILEYENPNLFAYLFYSIQQVSSYLGIKTQLIVSSSLGVNRTNKGKDRVLETCKLLGATDYYNAIGGIPLYEPYRYEFKDLGIQLYFLKMRDIRYPQFKKEFVPNLSIIDVMMFNSQAECHRLLNEYDLITEKETPEQCVVQ